jgi:AbrB family looped-hinge helix DNA binding protein
MLKSKLSTKGQFVIPDEIREEMGLKPGTEIIVQRLDKMNILLTPVPQDPIKALRGLTKGMFEEDAVTLIRKSRDEDEQKLRNKPWY